MFAALDRLCEAKITVNGDKCELRLRKLTFFGHELSSDGVSPSEEKIITIRDARPPKRRVRFDRGWGWFSIT